MGAVCPSGNVDVDDAALVIDPASKTYRHRRGPHAMLRCADRTPYGEEEEEEAPGLSSSSPSSSGAGPAPPVELSGGATLLRDATVRELNAVFPTSARCAGEWSLLFSTDRDGYSLRAMVAAAKCPRSLLVVRTTEGAIFGAFLHAPLCNQPVGRYFGGGETFVWALHGGAAGDSAGELSVWRWGFGEPYFVRVEGRDGSDRAPGDGGVCVGGGTGALTLDAYLAEGTTTRCETFESPPLCAPHPSYDGCDGAFVVDEVELWAVGDV